MIGQRDGYGEEMLKKYNSHFWDMHRADLQLAMYERAKEIGVEFEFGAIVTRHEFEDPAVILADGRYMESDLIIAADGIQFLFHVQY